jgi:hypothetical protein
MCRVRSRNRDRVGSAPTTMTGSPLPASASVSATSSAGAGGRVGPRGRRCGPTAPVAVAGGLLAGVAQLERLEVQGPAVAVEEPWLVEAERQHPVAGAAQVVVDEVTGGEGVVDHRPLADGDRHADGVGAVAVDEHGEAASTRRSDGSADRLLQPGQELVIDARSELGVEPRRRLPLEASEPGGPGGGPVEGQEQRDRRVPAVVPSGGRVDGVHGGSPGGGGRRRGSGRRGVRGRRPVPPTAAAGSRRGG